MCACEDLECARKHVCLMCVANERLKVISQWRLSQLLKFKVGKAKAVSCDIKDGGRTENVLFD